MIYLILLGILFFIQLLAASWYDIAKKAADVKKAFKHKMLCSATYMAGMLLCSAINGKPSVYSFLFIGAFTLFFLHDIIEEKSTKALSIISLILGFSAFIILGSAFFFKNAELFGNSFFSSEIHYAILIAVTVICVITDIKALKISQFISAVYMLFIAVMFGISLQNSENAKMQAASCAIIMGSLALTVSNGLGAFDKKDKKSLFRVNLYYFGLMFISCSVAVL